MFTNDEFTLFTIIYMRRKIRKKKKAEVYEKNCIGQSWLWFKHLSTDPRFRTFFMNNWCDKWSFMINETYSQKRIAINLAKNVVHPLSVFFCRKKKKKCLEEKVSKQRTMIRWIIGIFLSDLCPPTWLN